jgi:hypothetical protein
VAITAPPIKPKVRKEPPQIADRRANRLSKGGAPIGLLSISSALSVLLSVDFVPLLVDSKRGLQEQ